MENCNLSRIRKEKGITQEVMAERIGVAASTYCQFETGARTLTAETAQKICTVLEVEERQLFVPIRFKVRK